MGINVEKECGLIAISVPQPITIILAKQGTTVLEKWPRVED